VSSAGPDGLERPAQEPPAVVARKALAGVGALGLRQVAVLLISFAGNVVLARTLSPADFGIYAIVAFLLQAINIFGDGGLGASLIREIDIPTEDDLRQVFTVQQGLVVSVVGLAWIVAGPLSQLFGSPDAAWLLRLASLSLLISSFRSIPAILLERELAFGRIGIIYVLESLSFTCVAVVGALVGAGAYSFGVALVAQAGVGAAASFLFRPWRPRWSRPDHRIRRRLSFGIPFQGISVISLVKDSVSPIFVGLLLGPTQVGYIRWAQIFSGYALFALAILQRIYMPVFARLQGFKDQLAEAVELTIRGSNAVVAPIAVITLIYAHPLTVLVFGDKWEAALPIFYALWCANLFVPTAGPAMALLSAMGEARTAFGFALLWMAVTWAAAPPLILLFGPLGFGLANAVVQLTNVALYAAARRHVPFRGLASAYPPWVLGGLAGVASGLLTLITEPDTLPELAAHVSLFLGIYLVLILVFQASYVRRVAGLIGGRTGKLRAGATSH
jgi:O-antigen/teichoic acid export membrane protein